MNAFDIFMVLALGSLAGTGIGLTIGSLVKKRGTRTSIILRHEIFMNLALVVVCSGICVACLAWLSLV
jgi:hypothetical protein